MRIIIKDHDAEKVFCKADKRKGFLILFKKPIGATESDCESYYNDICDILNRQGAMFASDLVKSTDWEDDAKTTIGNTLYIRPFDEKIQPINGSDIINTFSGSFEEISLKGSQKIVAKIKINRKKSIWYYLFWVIALLAIIGGAILIMDKIENNRVAENQLAYNEDISKINILKESLEDACSPNNLYSKNISVENRNKITRSLSLLQDAADNNLQAVKDKGEYKHVDIDKTGIESLINGIIENAKLKYSKEEERGRINTNIDLYQRDIKMIDFWRKRALNLASKYNEESNSYFKNVIYMLDSLKSKADSNYVRVNESGKYIPIKIDSLKLESSIQKLIPKVKPKSKWHNYKRRW